MLTKIFLLAVLACLTTLVQTDNRDELPEFMRVCAKTNPNLNSCVIESIHNFRKYLADGIPTYDIPPLEPLDLKHAVISHSGLQIIAENSRFIGLSSFEVKRLKIVTHGKHYKLKLNIPLLYCEGNYTATGRFFNLPHKGLGKFKGNFTDVTLTVAIKMDQKIVNNDMHASLAKVELKINAKNGRFLLDRLLNGRAVFLQDLLNQSINENFQIWISELYPVMEEKIIETISVIINKISSSFTKAQLFP